MGEPEHINIRSVLDLRASGLRPGDRVHIATDRGYSCDDAVFRGTRVVIGAGGNENIVRIDIDGLPIEPPLSWHDITEFWPVEQRMSFPEDVNIQSARELRELGLQPGDLVHIAICGNYTRDDAVYRGMEFGRVKVDIDGKPVDPPLDWGDITEFWPVERRSG